MAKVEATLQIQLTNREAQELLEELDRLFVLPSNDMMNPEAPRENRDEFPTLSGILDLLREQLMFNRNREEVN